MLSETSNSRLTSELKECKFCKTSAVAKRQRTPNLTDQTYKDHFCTDVQSWGQKMRETIQKKADDPICQECIKEVRQKYQKKRKRKNPLAEAALDISLTALKNSQENSTRIDDAENKIGNLETSNKINQTVISKVANKVYNPTEEDTKKDAKRLKEYSKKQKRIDIEKKSQETIYRWKGSPKHQMGWIFFFILVPLGFRKYFKLKNKKVKINNPFDEIKDKFESWRLNIYGSLSFYVIFFILTEQALTKFRPWLEKFVNNHQIFAFWFTALLLGILLVIDGFISSNLKTNLQRLSFSVEKTIDDKDLKKKIFFKTQDSTETLKENFKKFGMLAIPTMIVGILGATWKEHWLSYGYYLIPVGYSFIRILEVNNVLKKIKLTKATNDDSRTN